MILKERTWQWVELLYLLVLKELKVRYKRSVIGYLWAIANPIFFALVYWMSFKFIMRVQMEHYIVYILTGIFPWGWFSQALTQGAGSFTNNLSLVRRVALPKLILPLGNVLQEMVHFVFTIPVVYIFIITAGLDVHPMTLLWQMPLMLILQIAFVFPLTVICAVLNVYVRDIQYLVGVLLSLFFFITPMVYSLDMVPTKYQQYFKINPLYWLIDSWRIVFSGGILPLYNLIFLLLSITVFSFFAWWIYRLLAGRIAELL